MNRVSHRPAVPRAAYLSLLLSACLSPPSERETAIVGSAPPSPWEPPEHAPGEPHVFDECPEGTCPRELPAYLFSGEFHESAVDLRIPGRGLDFVWARRYRSRVGATTAQGVGWDFSYNIHVIPQVIGGTTVMEVHDGNNRPARFEPQPDGTFAAPGYHRVLRVVRGRATMEFADSGTWEFRSFSDTTAPGKIARIRDRNGNAIAFSYDATGRLATITDTLGRDYTVGYDGAGRIASVTDFAGRSVTYSYYGAGSPDGLPGDLESVTYPPIIRTSTGNDFPNGTSVRYTYSVTGGSAPSALDHNLLTITDERGNTYLRNTYASTTDPSDLEYDRLIEQVWGDPGDIIGIHYRAAAAADPAGTSVVAILNDRVGAVSEHFFDADNRRIAERLYTGFADPDRPTTETLNRPTGKLRATDPDFYETTWTYNADHHVIAEVTPRGDRTEYLYEGDLTAPVSPRRRGNLLEIRRYGATTPDSCDFPVVTTRYEYDPRFGNEHGGRAFVTKIVDPLGYELDFIHDKTGNRIEARAGWAGSTESWDYDAFGQVTRHTFAEDELRQRQVDEITYYTTGAAAGYVAQRIQDARGIRATTSYVRDARGNVLAETDPRGFTTTFEYNSRDRLIREIRPPVQGVSHYSDNIYDAAMNVVRIDTVNVDENGVLRANDKISVTYEYDVLNEEIRESEELLDGRVLERELTLTANRNIDLARQGAAVSGQVPGDTVRFVWDERGLLFREIKAEGTPDELIIQHDYDANGNEVRTIVDAGGTPRITEYRLDCQSRRVSVVDPMGNEQRTRYDRAGKVLEVSLYGEDIDVPGGAGNHLLARSERIYDLHGRHVRTDEHHFDPATGLAIGDGIRTTAYATDPRGRPIALADARAATTRTRYDSAGRVAARETADGSQELATRDLGGLVTTQTTILARTDGGAAASSIEARAYDALGREHATTLAGATVEVAQDSLGFATLARDQRQNLRRESWQGNGRLGSESLVLTDDGTGAGTVTGTLTVSQELDDSGRVTGQIDPEGHATAQTYDGQGRVVRVDYADGTFATNAYDAVGNLLEAVDTNGTRTVMTYDLLDRLTRVQVFPGPGVDAGTTEERMAYSGASQLVRSEDDDSVVTRAYDSLGYLLAEDIDGEAVSYVRDELGAALIIVYPSGRRVHYDRDELGRIRRVLDEGGRVMVGQEFEGSDLVARSLPGLGLATTIEYDAARRIQSTRTMNAATGAVIDARTYTWDGASNKIGETGTGGTGVFQYDSVDRLVASAVTGSVATDRSASFVYDLTGNRVSTAGTRCAGAYTQAGDDERMNRYSTTPCEQRGYTAAGELAATTATGPDGHDRSFVYDFRGRLASVQIDDGASVQRIFLHYDVAGRLLALSASQDGAPAVLLERRFYDGWRLLERRDGDGGVIATYVYGDGDPDAVSYRDAGGTDVYLLKDALGSTVAAVHDDGSGVHVTRYEYEDYGWPHEVATGAGLDVAPLFAGMHWLGPARLYEARSRFYDPLSGRFLTPDPIGLWGDEKNFGNGYTYAGNNPGSAIDVMGTYWTPIFRDCKSSEKEDIKQALRYAEDYARMGQRQVNWVNEKKTQKGKRSRWYEAKPLREYFGTFKSSTRFKVVRNNVRDVFRRCRETKIKFKCRTKASLCDGSGTSAWTMNTWTSAIRLCRTESGDSDERSFWDIGGSTPGGAMARPRSYDEGSPFSALESEVNEGDMASIIVHESSHNVGPIGDHSYGTVGTRSFANRKPHSAGYNADSYELFIHACARGLSSAKRCL